MLGLVCEWPLIARAIHTQLSRLINELLRISFPKSAAKLLLIFSAKVQKMHFALREFFTLLDKLYAIFRTNRSTYVGY